MSTTVTHQHLAGRTADGMQVVEARLAQQQQLPEVCGRQRSQVFCHDIPVCHLGQQLLQL